MSLQQQEAVIEYNGAEVTPSELVDRINEMGFTSRDKSSPYEDTVIYIDGMTCMSCVRSIQVYYTLNINCE